MPLLAFLASNPKEVAQLTIEQIVTMAGDGVLKDNSICCSEFREYLRQVADSSKLGQYVERCLASAFPNNGFVLQDLINELGRRLDYKVSNGRYRGTQNSVGFDGVWLSPEGQTIVAEVKTTDAYTVKLETIATYRAKLLNTGEINEPSSILIVVGRQDTGELEAQIRGSRYAWNIRVISVEALLKLVQLKEESEETETGLKIRSLLTPMEFTRLDNLVDVMFTTAKDVEAGIAEAAVEQLQPEPRASTSSHASSTSGWEFTDSAVLDSKRNEIIEAMSRKLGAKLIRRSRALYWDVTHEKRVVCSISKRYSRGAAYWYAYHPKWDEFLAEATDGYFVLGCMDLSFAFAIPVKVMKEHLELLNTTTTDKGKIYWHVHLVEDAGNIELVVPGKEYLPLSQYKVTI